MALATLPPAVEIREIEPLHPVRLVTEAFFAESGFCDMPWKTLALSRINSLEYGKNTPGLGDLRPSEEATNRLRLCLNEIRFYSLPIPTVVALSGNGIQVTWQSGLRTVEATAFADGEIVFEALENGEFCENIPGEGANLLLAWLVRPPEVQQANATAR